MSARISLIFLPLPYFICVATSVCASVTCKRIVCVRDIFDISTIRSLCTIKRKDTIINYTQIITHARARHTIHLHDCMDI